MFFPFFYPKVDITPVSRDRDKNNKVLHVMKLTLREPRMRRVIMGHVATRSAVTIVMLVETTNKNNKLIVKQTNQAMK